jgi:hypothetical protein
VFLLPLTRVCGDFFPVRKGSREYFPQNAQYHLHSSVHSVQNCLFREANINGAFASELKWRCSKSKEGVVYTQVLLLLSGDKQVR